MSKKPQTFPARTKGDLKIIHADGTVEIVSKTEADVAAREIVRTIDVHRERELWASDEEAS